MGRAGPAEALPGALRSHLAPCRGRRIWVERSGGTPIAAGTPPEALSEARRVLLLRDGAGTAPLMHDVRRRGSRSAPGRGCGRSESTCWTRSHHERGAALPVVAVLGGFGAMRRAAATHPSLAECGAFWSAVMHTGLAPLGGGPALLAVRCEVLCRAPRPQIERLRSGRHLTGTAPEGRVATVEGLRRPCPSRAATSHPNEICEFHAVCATTRDAIEAWLRTTGDRSMP